MLNRFFSHRKASPEGEASPADRLAALHASMNISVNEMGESNFLDPKLDTFTERAIGILGGHVFEVLEAIERSG